MNSMKNYEFINIIRNKKYSYFSIQKCLFLFYAVMTDNHLTTLVFDATKHSRLTASSQLTLLANPKRIFSLG